MFFLNALQQSIKFQKAKVTFVKWQKQRKARQIYKWSDDCYVGPVWVSTNGRNNKKKTGVPREYCEGGLSSGAKQKRSEKSPAGLWVQVLPDTSHKWRRDFWTCHSYYSTLRHSPIISWEPVVLQVDGFKWFLVMCLLCCCRHPTVDKPRLRRRS